MQMTPSPDQIRQISALVPRQRGPPPKAVPLLDHLLDVCRTDWICDFLFTEDPIHIPFLTSPTLSRSALTCDVTTTRAEAQSFQSDPNSLYGERQHKTSRFLFAPAFAVDQKTFGFGIMDASELRSISYSPEDFNYSFSYLNNSRFMWDARTRMLLNVNDSPAHDCITIYYSRQVSTTFNHSITARFKRSLLLASLRKENGTLIIQKIFPALIYILEEDQHRSCPICNSDHLTGCRCVMPLAKPTNPFDFGNFKTGFLQHFGFFEGVANKLRSKNGQQVKHSVFGVRTLRRGIIDTSLVHKLSQWSVSDHLNAVPENPRQSVCFEKHPDVAIEDHPASSEELDANQEAKMLLVKGTSAPVDDIHGELTELIGALENNQLNNMKIYQQILRRGEQKSPESESKSRNCRPGASAMIDLTDNIQESKNIGDFDVIGDKEWDNWCAMEVSGDVPPSPMVRRRRKSQREDPDDIIATLLRLETEKRRICSNRESARRCNERNRLAREKLKAEVLRAHEKEEYLRRREMKLREENLELRTNLKMDSGQPTGSR